TRLFIPVGLRPEIEDADVTLWVTEGEKKALAACQAGLACIAAPGVHCFGDADARWASKGLGEDERILHPDFGRVPLSGRTVIICFDSDMDTNPTVLKAAVTLAQMLDAAGAIVKIAHLDSGGTKKVGLDDILAALPAAVRDGSSPLGGVEESARPFNPV